MTTNTNNPSPEIEPTTNNESIHPFVETQKDGFWDNISRKFTEAREGLYTIPVVNKIVGKMEIAYNQFWIDKKESKGVKIKNKMDGLNIKNDALSQTAESIREAGEVLESMGISSSSTDLKEKKILAGINKNENKLDNLQGKLENKENEIKNFTNKRDSIADRLINHYEKKLSPIEGKLAVLEERRSEIELFCISREVLIDEQKANIKIIEEKRDQIMKQYMSAGYKDKEIKKDCVLKELNKHIENIYTHIQIEKAKIDSRRNEINQKISKVNKKAEPYRNNKNKFIRIKESRPIDFNLKERKYADEFKSHETTSSHPREDGEDIYYDDDNKDEQDYSEKISFFENKNEKLEVVVDIIERYEKYLEVQKISGLSIDIKEFLEATRLPQKTKLTIENFGKILKQFYKAKKIRTEEYEKIINNFK